MLNEMSGWKWLVGSVLALLVGGLSAPPARADYVGELETTKYFDPATVALIQSRLPGGLLAGDQVSYFIQFTPTDNGGNIGAGSFMTDYIPAGTQVIDAQFVHLNSDGTYTKIAPPTPAAVYPAYLPMYTDTGIFYSTDPRTAVYTQTASPSITPTNGYALTKPNSSGCTGISLPSTTHNAWDSAMYATFYNVNGPSQSGTCTSPPATNYATAGLSPVAGPNTYLTKDSTGATGPWQRISYPGSLIGTSTGVAVAGTDSGTAVTNACVGGVPTSAGWNLSAANPLPINTNAVRFAAGKVTVGELFTVRITLKLTANMPTAGIINNTEVFGGDIGLDLGNAGSYPSYWNQWHYHCPAVAVSNSQILLQKTLVGACTGTGCTPTAIMAGVVPSAANLKLRYQIQYVNLSGATQTTVKLTDKLASGGAYVANSYALISGTGTGAPSGTTTLTFPTIASLGSGASGTIQYDVNIATRPADGTALINTATLVSDQVPSPGVTSKAIATVSSQANLWISKATSTPSVTSGDTVSYAITIPNNGATGATNLVVNDYLPSAGGSTINDRFSYATNSVVANIVTATGAVIPLTPSSVSSSVATASPYAGLNREQVVITFPTTVASAIPGCPSTTKKGVTTYTACIPMGGKLTINFNATVGSNVPASSTPYLNDANVWYGGGPGGTAANSSYSETIGTAPVTVTAPMTLATTVDCVYAGATCVPYSNGTIAPGSKIRYRLAYKNISAAALNGVVLTDTLPANTSFVTGTAIRDGSAVTPTVSGQVLSFPSVTLAAGANGYVTFDVQLGAAITSGIDITDTAKIVAGSFAAGVTASVTTSVRDQANLQVTKTASPGAVQTGGLVTYTITVTNTGNAVASGIKIYDELPFTGALADSTKRFNFTAGSSSFATTDTSANKLVAVAPTTSVPPTFTGYTVQTNEQEVLWTFDAAQQLAPGQSFTLTYTASAGSNIPASTTVYTSDVQALYVSSSNNMQASATNTAPVTIGGLDHLRITHTGQGLTCEPSTLTVDACADAACSTFYTGSVSALFNGMPSVTTFSGGTTTLSLSQTTAGNFTLGASSISPTPQNATPVSCTTGATTSCVLTFSDAGLILAAAAGGSEATVPTQVAGVVSSQYILRAVKKNTATGACTAALTGSQTVNFAYECNDPTACATGNLLSINGTAVQSNNNNPLLSYSYTGIGLTFDSNGDTTTPISFSYEDVGQITLRMQKTINGKDVFGNSNAFVVIPHHLAVDVCAAATAGDCALGTAATPIDGSGPVLAVAGTAASQAGAAFKATVRAMSANSNITPSFGVAGSANGGTSQNTETVTLVQTCVAPIIAPAIACAAGGTLAGTISSPRSSFVQGVGTVSDLTWSEVGALTITATNGGFMGAGSSSGTSAYAGRFKPDHFNTVATGQMACAGGLTCPSGGMEYSGEVFKVVTVLAMNANNAQTANYQGGFAKTADLSAVDAPGGVASTAGTMAGTTTIAASAFTGGSGSLNGTLSSNNGAPLFALSALPSVPTDVYVRAVDSEGVTSLRPSNSSEGGVKVVSGRIKVSNAYGSELLPLTLVATAQYYTANGWLNSVTDGVTQLSLAATYPVASGTTAATPNPSGAVLSGGSLTIGLGKPTAGAGVALVAPGAPGYLPVIGGRATFGVYQSSSNLIYRRERY